jgi:DNA repair protein RadC
MYELEEIEDAELRPREKLVKKGVEALSEAELLAIILNSGTRKEGVFEMASRVMREYGLSALTPARDYQKLQQHLLIGEVKAMQLASVMEFGRRAYLENKGKRLKLNTPEKIWKKYRFMAEKQREEFRGLYINKRQFLLGSELLAIGSLEMIYVSKRDIFAPAIDLNARGIVLIHNHPTGNPEPSVEDKELTKEIEEAAKMLGLVLLDHVIIGSESYFSFRLEGLIANQHSG